MKHLEVVLFTLEKHQLFVNAKKCEFGKERIAYLGHVIWRDGVEMNKEKIQAILSWPLSTLPFL